MEPETSGCVRRLSHPFCANDSLRTAQIAEKLPHDVLTCMIDTFLRGMVMESRCLPYTTP